MKIKKSKNKRTQISRIGAIFGANGQEIGREETEIEKRMTVTDRAFSNSLPSYMPFLFQRSYLLDIPDWLFCAGFLMYRYRRVLTQVLKKRNIFIFPI